jgi:hypothetical protein
LTHPVRRAAFRIRRVFVGIVVGVVGVAGVVGAAGVAADRRGRSLTTC